MDKDTLTRVSFFLLGALIDSVHLHLKMQMSIVMKQGLYFNRIVIKIIFLHKLTKVLVKNINLSHFFYKFSSKFVYYEKTNYFLFQFQPHVMNI